MTLQFINTHALYKKTDASNRDYVTQGSLIQLVYARTSSTAEFEIDEMDCSHVLVVNKKRLLGDAYSCETVRKIIGGRVEEISINEEQK